MGRLDEPWSVGRLAQALGLSARTLHRVVRRELGVSPMRLLRQTRLAQARSALAAPRPGTTVTTVALDSGFNHLGRFAQQYARHFGESPSETLRRARRRQAAGAGGIPEMATAAA
ncbi:MAG TPA: helix-turn-helix transcriptional regulator [Vicinamibacteria bacterium]